jgi:hypothetical protein
VYQIFAENKVFMKTSTGTYDLLRTIGQNSSSIEQPQSDLSDISLSRCSARRRRGARRQRGAAHEGGAARHTKAARRGTRRRRGARRQAEFTRHAPGKPAETTNPVLLFLSGRVFTVCFRMAWNINGTLTAAVLTFSVGTHLLSTEISGSEP